MITEHLGQYINYLKFEKRYAPLTLEAYQRDIEQFIQYLATQFDLHTVQDVANFHIRSWLAEKKDLHIKARSLNRHISCISGFFKYLQKQNIVQKNPVLLLHAQKQPERLPTFIKENEAAYLLDEIDFPTDFNGRTDRIICTLLYTLGLRRQELLQIKLTDIERSLLQIRVLGKGNKERLIPINRELLSMIDTYVQEKQLLKIDFHPNLLVLEDGNPLYPMYIYRTVNKYLTKATTLNKKSPHVLRHSFATHLLNNGANIQAIKELLGHSSLAATQIYTHNNIAKLKEIHKQNHPRG